MSEEKVDSGEGFLLGLMWLIFGWFPGFMYSVIYMEILGVNTLSAKDPVLIGLFVIGFITFPIWILIFGVIIGGIIWISNCLLKLLS